MKAQTHLPLLICLLALNPLLQAQTWSRQGPSSRHSQTAVWDASTSKMIIFGGQETTTNFDLNDVWLGATAVNENDSFIQTSPTGTPPQGRYGHVATYDSSTNRMMVFGGAEGMPAPCANDFWILDGANGAHGAPNWIAENPAGTAPAARVYSGGAFDPTSDSLIVFGGYDCASQYFNDVWVLSGANGEMGTPTWTQLSTSGRAPSPRESASVVYDSANNILIVYGGDSGSTTTYGDVWVLSNANGTGGTAVWTQLSPSGTAPMSRTGQSGVYDSTNNRMIIFGGANRSQTLVDSWILTSPNGLGSPSWIQLKPAGTSPSTSYHSAVYNPALNQMYTFAGTSSADKLTTNSHSFALANANGLAQTTPKWTLGGPAVRYGQSIFYDSVTNDLFVWGGQHSRSNLNFADYWQASNVLRSGNLTWKIVAAKSGAPSARYGQTGLYDSGSNRLMIFGGSTGTCQNDYHVLQHANTQGGTPTWLAITPAGTKPPARTLQASAYDSATNTIIVFGGWNCSTTYFNDVWILSNANDVSAQPAWTLLQPAGTPPSARESSSAIYDPSSNSLIVFGGDAGGKNYFNDIWILSNANGTGGTPTWTQFLPLNNGPSVRSGHTATYDAANNIMTVYAGSNGTQVLSDLWMLSGANGQTGAATWTQSTSGQPRRLHSSVYDPTSNTMITFGGSSSINPLVPSADIYQLSDANGLPRK